MKFSWLWSEVYKGLEISRGQRQLLWLGWTTRKFKKLGWYGVQRDQWKRER